MKSQLIHFAIHNQSELKRLIAAEVPVRILAKLDASDIFQQTVVELMAAPESTVAVNPGAFRSWFLRAMHNNLLDGLRRFVLNQKRALSRERSLSTSEVGENHRSMNTEADGMRAEDRRFVLEVLLDRLKPEYSSVLRMHFIEGKSYAEIGAMVERSEDAVRMLANRALKSAQELFRLDGYSSPSV